MSRINLTDLNDPQPDRVYRVERRWVLSAEQTPLRRRKDEKGELGRRSLPLPEHVLTCSGAARLCHSALTMLITG